MLARLAAAFGCLLLASVPSWAHHATATNFDVTKLTLLQGTVREVEWINPHAWLHLEVKDSAGKITVWRIEGASPGAMAFRNFSKDSLPVGLEISITVYPAKSGVNVADGGTITFADGKRFFFGGSAPVDGVDKDGKPCVHISGSQACRFP
jgi:hypothetical protein